MVFRNRVCINIDRLTTEILELCCRSKGVCRREIIERLARSGDTSFLKNRVAKLVKEGILIKSQVYSFHFFNNKSKKWDFSPSLLWNLIPGDPTIKKIIVTPVDDSNISPLILLRWKHKLKKNFKDIKIIFNYTNKNPQELLWGNTCDLLILIANAPHTPRNIFELGRFCFSRARYKLVTSKHERAYVLNFSFFFHLMGRIVFHLMQRFRVIAEISIIKTISYVYLFLTFNMFKNRNEESRGKILFVFPGAVGDVVTISPVIRAIREKYIDAWITFAAGASIHSNLEFCPFIDEVIYYDNGRLREGKKVTWFTICKFVLKLKRRGKFDKIIAALSNWPTRGNNWPGWSGYLMGFLDANEKVGWSEQKSPPPKKVFTTWIEPKSKHIIDKWAEVLKALGINDFIKDTEVWYDPESDAYVDDYLKKKNISKKRLLVGFFPGAGSGNTKRWPMAKFARLADMLIERYDAQIFILGGTRDTYFCNEVLYYMKGKGEIFCKGSLSRGMAMMKKLDIIISNDSGPMHISAALKKPTAAIFGPTDSETWAPKVDGIEIIKRDICLPCGEYSFCSLGERLCMDSISVDEVYSAVVKLLNDNVSLKIKKRQWNIKN